jgi:hypothetical protein
MPELMVNWQKNRPCSRPCHRSVISRRHDERAINDKRRNATMECEDFLEPEQDQEYDDDHL